MSTTINRTADVPDRGQTREQRLANLAKADAIRYARAALKRELAVCRKTVADVLDDPDVQTMQVGKLLLAQPFWGAAKVRRALAVVGIRPYAQIGRLTPRQRGALIAFIDDHQSATARRLRAANAA